MPTHRDDRRACPDRGEATSGAYQLTIERFQTSLTIYGQQMKGTRVGGQRPWLISLQKKR